jgi:hypothetical protein
MTSSKVASEPADPHGSGAKLGTKHPFSGRVKQLTALPVLLLFAASVSVACSSDSPEPITADATTSTAVAAVEPSIEVTYFSVDPDFDVMRFVAEITNNANEPLVGLRTEWIAYDANDVILGNRIKEQPAIPAGATFAYVGGAGSANLTGTPARVEVTVVDAGDLDPEAASPLLQVADVTVNPNPVLGGFEDATSTVTAPPEGVRKDELAPSLIIRDAEGSITEADFIGDILGPDVFPGGSKFSVRFSLFDYEGPADEVEIQVYVDTSD